MMETEEKTEEWDGDKEDQWTRYIDEAHPTKTKNFKLHAIAMEMVGNRHSKHALVDLVNWLLTERGHDQ